MLINIDPALTRAALLSFFVLLRLKITHILSQRHNDNQATHWGVCITSYLQAALSTQLQITPSMPSQFTNTQRCSADHSTTKRTLEEPRTARPSHCDGGHPLQMTPLPAPVRFPLSVIGFVSAAFCCFPGGYNPFHQGPGETSLAQNRRLRQTLFALSMSWSQFQEGARGSSACDGSKAAVRCWWLPCKGLVSLLNDEVCLVRFDTEVCHDEFCCWSTDYLPD